MLLHILRKDLKRKKTMNIILLLFVIFSAMFAASSVNNIITVTGGIDYYFEKAGINDVDHFFLTINRDNEKPLDEILANDPAVDSMMIEELLFNASGDITVNGKKALDFDNASMVMPIDNAKITFFDQNNDPIESVPQGKFYITGNFTETTGVKVGDKIDITVGDTTVTLEYYGRAKDAFLGSNFMHNPRLILNGSDYQEFMKSESALSHSGKILYVRGDDKQIEKAASASTAILFDGPRSLIETTYIMEILVAGILLVVSVILILIAFVVLRFTIGFTIAEEFREIGVMKAIGIKNRHIRFIYIVKYLGISIVGAVIGYFASIPFGEMMLGSATSSMVLGNGSEVLIGALSAAAVVGIIVIFCYGCTRKIKKLSPIDAVRNGQTGERFRKRSIMSLGRSRLSTGAFLPVNDVVSAPKQYGMITMVFTVCLMLIMILANTANTLRSDKLLFVFSITESDLYYTDSSSVMKIMGTDKGCEKLIEQLEKDLADNGMPGNVYIENWYKIPAQFGEVKQNITMMHCPETKTTDYVYERGTAPQNAKEFAATQQICDKFGFDIGDKVKLTVSGETDDYLLTGVFQTMNNAGSIGRLHEDAPLETKDMMSAFGFQISFDDHPDEKTIEERKEKLKDIWDSDKVETRSEFVNSTTGVSDTIASMKDLVLILTLMIIIMITVLMERSFITREKSEIALMKALGFKDIQIIRQHAMRFGIVAVLAGIISAALCLPLTKLLIDPIFSIMGAINGVEYLIKPAEIFCIYPLMMIAAITLSAFMTAVYTRTVSASDTANIE